MKIAVMGWSGAGKSTLARALGEKYSIPVLHLDAVQFTPGWQERDRGEAKAMVARFMDGPSWVIDGNYTGFYQKRRVDEADRIIFLDLPRLSCFRRVCRRYRRYRGMTREDMAEGCNEKLDREFALWVLWKGRGGKKRRKFQEIQLAYPEKTVVLKSQREIDRYLEGLPC